MKKLGIVGKSNYVSFNWGQVTSVQLNRNVEGGELFLATIRRQYPELLAIYGDTLILRGVANYVAPSLLNCIEKEEVRWLKFQEDFKYEN